MEKKYRVGLIGVGSIAHIAHLPILAARTGGRLPNTSKACSAPKRAMPSKTLYITWTSC